MPWDLLSFDFERPGVQADTSAPDFGKDEWENHDTCCPEHHEGPQWEQNPDREEGDGEEVAEQHEGLLNQTCKEADRSVHDTDLEVAEAASLESEEIGI
jgi:hypothetical protein